MIYCHEQIQNEMSKGKDARGKLEGRGEERSIQEHPGASRSIREQASHPLTQEVLKSPAMNCEDLDD
jgi:hypothetical protein